MYSVIQLSHLITTPYIKSRDYILSVPRMPYLVCCNKQQMLLLCINGLHGRHFLCNTSELQKHAFGSDDFHFDIMWLVILVHLCKKEQTTVCFIPFCSYQQPKHGVSLSIWIHINLSKRSYCDTRAARIMIACSLHQIFILLCRGTMSWEVSLLSFHMKMTVNLCVVTNMCAH